MNEDLKKIKQHAYVLGGDEPETIGQQSAGIIIACAERMADEIDRLKAELEKRPEVVYCEGCIYKNQCKAAVIFQESTPKMEGPFKFYYLKFCSYGQRRESEGGK